MKRACALALLGSLYALAGCERDRPAVDAPPQAAAVSATPLTFENKTADVEVTLTLPAALRSQPALHKAIYEEEVAALSSFAKDARGERQAIGMDLPPYFRTVEWRVAAETDRLLSLTREGSEYTGGAHPNTGVTTRLWDKQAGRAVTADALFPTAAAHPALEGRLCDALKAEKAERGGVPLGGDTWTCPRWRDVTLALDGGPGKAAGVTAIFSPYEVGPYSEGMYEVTLPASAVRPAVAPAYQNEFAG